MSDKATPETDEMHGKYSHDGALNGFVPMPFAQNLERERDELREANQWRPIGDGLPEYMRSVLVWCPRAGNIFCAYYYFHAGSNDPDKKPIWAYFDDVGKITKIKDTVTRWQRLPKPPT